MITCSGCHRPFRPGYGNLIAGHHFCKRCRKKQRLLRKEPPLPQPEVDLNVSVIKKGEICIRTSIRRSLRGLRIEVQAHPTVEQLMHQWGNGEHHAVQVYGRNWIPVNGGEIKIYHSSQPPDGHPYNGGYYYLTTPGQPLLPDGEGINLSFLRIVGISEGNGRTFEVRGVQSLDQIQSLGEKIKHAAKRFYVDYLLPVELSVFVQTQEIRL